MTTGIKNTDELIRDLLKNLSAEKPITLTSAESKQYGYDLPAGWSLQISGTPESPQYKYINPYGQEPYMPMGGTPADALDEYALTTPQYYEAERKEAVQALGEIALLRQALERLFPERLSGHGSIQLPEVQQEVISLYNSVLTEAQEDSEGFLKMMYDKGRSQEAEVLMKSLNPEITDELLDEFYAPDPYAPLKQAFLNVYPYYKNNVGELMEWAVNNEDAFFDEIHSLGLNKETWNLMKQVNPAFTDAELVQFFASPKTLGHEQRRISDSFLSAVETGMQYTDGWWRTGLMELGFEFGRFLEWTSGRDTRWYSHAERIMDEAYKKHGWMAIFSPDVTEAWDVYFKERLGDNRFTTFSKGLADFSNPLYFLPVFKTVKFAMKPLAKIPVIGDSLFRTAEGVVNVSERELTTFPTVKRGARWLAGKPAVKEGGKVAESLAEEAERITPRPYLMSDLPSSSLLDKWLFQNDYFRKISSRIPLLKRIAPASGLSAELPKVIDNVADMEAGVVRQYVKRNAILEVGQSQKGQALARIKVYGNTKKLLGVRDALCDPNKVVPMEKGASLALGDVAQAPERYYFKEKGAFEYLKWAQRLCKEAYELAGKQGVSIKKAQLEPFEEYVHWVCTGVKDKGGIVRTWRKGSRAVGSIPSSQKRRRNEAMIEGLKRGYKYSDNLEDYVGSYIDDIYKSIADHRFGIDIEDVMNRLSPDLMTLPTKPAERMMRLYPEATKNWWNRAIESRIGKTPTIREAVADLGVALSGVKQQLQFDRMLPSTLRAIRKRVPAIADRIDVAMMRKFELPKEVSPEILEKIEDVTRELWEYQHEMWGLQEYLNLEPANDLVYLVKRGGAYKGEIPDITVKQYQELTGFHSIPPANSLTKDGKHVRWEYVFDQFASERGYATGEELREAVLKAYDTRAQIEVLKKDVRYATAEYKALQEAIKPVTIDRGSKKKLKALIWDRMQNGRSIPKTLETSQEAVNKYVESLNRKSVQQIYKSYKIKSNMEQLYTDLLGEKEYLMPEWKKARRARAEAMESARKTHPRQTIHGEAQITTSRGNVHPMFQNQIFPEPIAEKASSLLNSEVNQVLKYTEGLSTGLRLQQAALDISAGAIQGFVAMFSHPVKWYKAQFLALETMIDPQTFQRYLVKNAVAINERNFYLGNQKAFEFFEAMGLAQRAFSKIPYGKAVLGETYGRAESAFSMYATVFKNEMWKATSKKWLKAGQGFDYARYLDRMSGMTSFRQLGMPVNLKSFLSGWVSFAPQYRMSVLSYFADFFKGGMTGVQARKDIASMVAGATAMYYGFCKITGNKPYLNPFTDGKKFMSINVDGHWVGLGSAVISLTKAYVDILASMLSIGDNQPSDLWTFTPYEFAKWKNPMMRALFTQSAVLPSLLSDLITRRDYLGYPIGEPEADGEEWVSWGKWAGEQVTPIWLQNILYDHSGIPPTMLSTVAEFVGLRTSPQTRWETLDDKIRNEKAWETISDLTDEQRENIEGDEDVNVLSVLDSFQKTELLTNFPEIKEFYETAMADALLRAEPLRRDYERAITGFKTSMVERLNKAMNEGVKANGEDLYYLRDKYEDIMRQYGIELDTLHKEKDGRYQPLLDEWEEARIKRLEDAETFDIAYWEYIENVVSPDREKDSGDFDYKAYQEALSAWREKWGEDYYGKILYIQKQKKLALPDYPDWAIKLWDDKLKITDAGYWDLPNKPIYQYTEKEFIDGDLEEQAPQYVKLWLEYNKLTANIQREEFKALHPEVARDWRAEMRASNPELDARLAFWGYGGQLQTKEAYDMVSKWADEVGVNISQVGLDLPPDYLVDPYFEHLDIARQTSPNSPQVRLFKLTHDDYLEWGITEKNWTRPDDNIKALDIKVRWADLIAEKESYKELYPDEDEREDAVKRLYKREPDFRDDMRRADVYDTGIEDSLTVEGWVEYNKKVDAYGANSSEAMLYRYDNSYVNDWMCDDSLRGKSKALKIEAWNKAKVREPIWRIDVAFRENDEAYKAILDKYTDQKQQTDATDSYLAKNPIYRVARYTRDALNKEWRTEYSINDIYERVRDKKPQEIGKDGKQDLVMNFVEYNSLPDTGYWKERYLLSHDELYRTLLDRKDIKVQLNKRYPDEKRDILYLENKDTFEKYNSFEGTADAIAEQKERLLYQEPDFRQDLWRYNAYDKYLPETVIEDYVGYQEIIFEGRPPNADRWYEDDWYMIEHPELERAMYDSGIWKEFDEEGNRTRDYEKVPTREVFEKYGIYQNLPLGKARKDYRAKNRDLDAWLVLSEGYKPIEYTLEEAGKSLSEKQAIQLKRYEDDMYETIKQRDKDWEKRLDELQRLVDELLSK